MLRHKFPEGPWQCLALDLMGPLPNKDMVLVIIDYYFRYQEVKFPKTTTSAIITTHLLELFSRPGFPKSLRTDNGRQFVSNDFKQFCKNHDIELIQTPPYWPQANGEVENMNRSILKRLQIAHANRRDYQAEIQKFIPMYNVTSHGTTGKSPSQLLFGRTIRDKIPSIGDLVDNERDDEEARDTDINNNQKGKTREDKARGSKDSDIQPGDRVVTQNMMTTNKLEGRYLNEEYEVIEKKGNEVTLQKDGKTFKRHTTHVKKLPTETIQNCSPSSTMSGSTEPTEDVEDNSTRKKEIQEPVINPDSKSRITPIKLKRKEGLWRPVTEVE